jgi:hypothetical protein
MRYQACSSHLGWTEVAYDIGQIGDRGGGANGAMDVERSAVGCIRAVDIHWCRGHDGQNSAAPI